MSLLLKGQRNVGVKQMSWSTFCRVNVVSGRPFVSQHPKYLTFISVHIPYFASQWWTKKFYNIDTRYSIQRICLAERRSFGLLTSTKLQMPSSGFQRVKSGNPAVNVIKLWLVFKIFLATNGTAHFFKIVIDYTGCHWKSSQFIMPLKSIYNKNFSFDEHCRKIKTAKIFIISIFFFHKKMFTRSLLFMLDKDMHDSIV